MVAHLGMSGQFRLSDKQRVVDRHARATFRLHDGRRPRPPGVFRSLECFPGQLHPAALHAAAGNSGTRKLNKSENRKLGNWETWTLGSSKTHSHTSTLEELRHSKTQELRVLKSQDLRNS